MAEKSGMIFLLILCNYSCESANIVCLIHCQNYQEAQYIMKIGSSFRYQFNNHTRSDRKIVFSTVMFHC